jgi:hypothetical protein
VLGSRKIAYLLAHVESLHSLNVSNNELTDDGVAAILETLGQPTFMDEPEDGCDGAGITHRRASFNGSITDLNIAGTGMAELSTEMLVTILRSNESLAVLNLDMNPYIPKPLLKSLGTILRVNNSCLEMLSFCDGDHTVKSFGYMMKVLEGNAPIRKLSYARCSLGVSHISAVAKYVPKSHHLRHLDLSGNNFGDTGAQYVAAGVQVTVNSRSAQEQSEDDGLLRICALLGPLESNALLYATFAPLKSLDVSSCGIGAKGSKYIFMACSFHPTLTFLDLSDNILGASLEDVTDSLIKCRLIKLNLNRCDLRTTGARNIFKLLKDTSEQCLGRYLTSLSISGNNIGDSINLSLIDLLQHNLKIQFIDLGFNEISGLHMDSLREAILVPSRASIDKQILPLHINMIGNPCPDYMLETPWFARAKQTILFGLRKGSERPRNDDGTLRIAYDEVTTAARDQYVTRIDNFRNYSKNAAVVSINNIS